VDRFVFWGLKLGGEVAVKTVMSLDKLLVTVFEKNAWG
jgi:hypothetical protein